MPRRAGLGLRQGLGSADRVRGAVAQGDGVREDGGHRGPDVADGVAAQGMGEAGEEPSGLRRLVLLDPPPAYLGVEVLVPDVDVAVEGRRPHLRLDPGFVDLDEELPYIFHGRILPRPEGLREPSS